MSLLEIKFICIFLTLITLILLFCSITIVNLVITGISIYSNPNDWETCDGGKHLRIFVLGSFLYTMISTLFTIPLIMKKIRSIKESKNEVAFELFCWGGIILGIVILAGSPDCKLEDQSLYHTAFVSLFILLGRWVLFFIFICIVVYLFVIMHRSVHDVSQEQLVNNLTQDVSNLI